MDLASQYCPVRREIENHCWALVTRLSNSTADLLTSMGGGHQLFLLAKADCLSTRRQLADSRAELQAHRSFHGC